MRLGAFVTTYNRPGILRQTLNRLLQQSRRPEYILVIDNGSNPQTEEVVHSFKTELLGYHRMDFNSGPAGAGAYGLRALADDGFDWILCGDDDDPPLTHDALERLMRIALSGKQPLGAVGATGTPWDWRRGVRVRMRDFALDLPERGICYVDIVGGSQLLTVSRSVVAEVGLPNADLVFGFDDFEYCLRIRKAGFRIAIDAELFREYLHLTMLWKSTALIGRPPIKYPFPTWLRSAVPAGLHSRLAGIEHRFLASLGPRNGFWRQYYCTRNYIHFMRREFGSERLAGREAAKSLLRILRSWTQGLDYGRTFTKLQLQAIVDGYAGRMGLTVPPVEKYTGSTGT